MEQKLLRLDAHAAEARAALVFFTFARTLLAVPPDVLVNVGGNAFGVSRFVVVRFVLPVRMGDVHGVALGMGVDGDVRVLRALALVLGAAVFVLAFAGHVAAALSVHEVHKLFLVFGFGRGFGL
jgi:hypothetical protein